MTNRMMMVYLINAAGTNRYKIGVSINPKSRLEALSSGSPIDLAIVAQCPGDFRFEQALHVRHSSKHVRGEWFELGPDDVEALKLYFRWREGVAYVAEAMCRFNDQARLLQRCVDPLARIELRQLEIHARRSLLAFQAELDAIEAQLCPLCLLRDRGVRVELSGEKQIRVHSNDEAVIALARRRGKEIRAALRVEVAPCPL